MWIVPQDLVLKLLLLKKVLVGSVNNAQDPLENVEHSWSFSALSKHTLIKHTGGGNQWPECKNKFFPFYEQPFPILSTVSHTNLLEMLWSLKQFIAYFAFLLQTEVNRQGIYIPLRACPNIVSFFSAQRACSASSRKFSFGMSTAQLYPSYLRASPAIVTTLTTYSAMMVPRNCIPMIAGPCALAGSSVVALFST